jgi:hypothetical protein
LWSGDLAAKQKRYLLVCPPQVKAWCDQKKNTIKYDKILGQGKAFRNDGKRQDFSRLPAGGIA